MHERYTLCTAWVSSEFLFSNREIIHFGARVSWAETWEYVWLVYTGWEESAELRHASMCDSSIQAEKSQLSWDMRVCVTRLHRPRRVSWAETCEYVWLVYTGCEESAELRHASMCDSSIQAEAADITNCITACINYKIYRLKTKQSIFSCMIFDEQM